MKERDHDEDDALHPRTPSISSSSVPLVQGSLEERPPFLSNSSTDTKVRVRLKDQAFAWINLDPSWTSRPVSVNCRSKMLVNV